MTLRRALLSAAVAAAALAPLPAAQASCHYCVLPVDCRPLCESLDPFLAVADDACHQVNDALTGRMYCHG